MAATVGVAATLIVAAPIAQASAISVAADATCAGPDAWSATWELTLAGAPADARWSLAAGFPTPVTDPIVVERIVPLAAASIELELAVTIESVDGTIETIAGGTSTVGRPETCTSAPAPPEPPVAEEPTVDEEPPASEPSGVPPTAPGRPAAASVERSEPVPSGPAATEPLVASLAPPGRTVDRFTLAHTSFVEVSRSIVELARDWFSGTAPPPPT